jgi:hypothetical protein
MSTPAGAAARSAVTVVWPRSEPPSSIGNTVISAPPSSPRQALPSGCTTVRTPDTPDSRAAAPAASVPAGTTTSIGVRTPVGMPASRSWARPS